MNPATASLIARTYPEVVDDLLTALVGGVVNEPIIFDVKRLGYPLAEPASDIRSITGILGADLAHSFQKDIDYVFSASDNSVVWQSKQAAPDDNSIFYVDYYRKTSTSPLTDINVGSVTRTLAEAIGREIAIVYQQIQLAYFSGFIDSAAGKALDFVVSILGITRMTAEFAVGSETFFRDQAIAGSITIPQGTSLATTKGTATFQTTDQRTLQQGQARIDVPIRADVAFPGQLGVVAAGEITVVAQVIAGIAQVNNFDPTILGAQDETDDQLRLRAKAALRGLGKATIAALTQVVFSNRAKLDEILDPNTLNGKKSEAGTVTLLVETEAGRFPSLQAEIDETRAAGVLTTIVAHFIYFQPHISAKITPGLTGAGKDKIANGIIAALQSYADGLASAAPAQAGDMLTAIKGVTDVSDASFVDVKTWRSDVGADNLDPLVEALVAAVQSVNVQSVADLRAAISTVIDQGAPPLLPSGERIPDRTVIQTPAGQPATDLDIEQANFKIVPPATFSVTLDMVPDNIVLQES
jgi:hypothetical protein